MEIYETIIKQLGGTSRLVAMLGANNFLYSAKENNWVSFRFKGSKLFNHVKITLNSMDTYDVKFKKVWGMKITREKTFSNVYNDQLIPLFEQTTKLYLIF